MPLRHNAPRPARPRIGVNFALVLKFAIVIIANYSINTPANAQFFSKKPAASTVQPAPALPPACTAPVYLTLHTGDMAGAVAVADLLQKHQVRATFFVGNQPALDGKDSMSFEWGQKFWAQRGKEGHEFASATWDGIVFKGDAPGIAPQFVVVPSAGAFAGRSFTWEGKKVCAQIAQASDRIEDFTGKKALPLWRAPGGKVSPKLLAAVQACGFQQVPASALGLPGSDGALKKVLQTTQQGDIFQASLGAGPRKETAAAMLEPLVVGLKEKGLCFATLRDHPAYKPWVERKPG